MIGIDLFG